MPSAQPTAAGRRNGHTTPPLEGGSTLSVQTTTPKSTRNSPFLSGANARTSPMQSRRSGGGDMGAGPRRHNSLSEAEALPWLCCMYPAISLVGLYGLVIFSAIFSKSVFHVVMAALTFVSLLWVGNLAFSSLVGARKLRQYTKEDWHAKFEALQKDDPSANEVLHIVILPNYRENERMLLDTLENLGRSPMAKGRTRVVLAMEAREGQVGRDKAERLIQQSRHLFADIFATFHPEKVPGEVVGKSSNTQWAYRAALRQYGQVLLTCDFSKVFVTVGDADTLWHPQYLSAVTYEALTQPAESRMWKIWQPPILLVRNLWTVPAMTRASAHATLIFELSALANQTFFPAFAYSAYTSTLALVSHPEVDGWDVDVIAEDHHMFCKCYFAGLWEAAHAKKEKNADKNLTVRTSVELQPIFLPAVSYLVESTSGYWASVMARFTQARRHSQGVVELGYVLLQYCRLWKHTGLFGLPMRTHARILSIATKMHTLHITATAQCLALIMATLTEFIPKLITFVQTGGITMLFEGGLPAVLGLLTSARDGWGALNAAQQAFYSGITNISFVVVLYSFTCWFVICDLIEGNYYNHMGTSSEAIEDSTSDDSAHKKNGVTNGRSANGGSVKDAESRNGTCAKSKVLAESTVNPDGKPNFVTGQLSKTGRLALFFYILNDTASVGYLSIAVLALIPVSLAAFSLIRRGTQFEYVCAEKPE